MTQEPRSRIYTILFVTVLCLGVGVVAFQTLKPFLAAIAWAIVLAIAVWPLWQRALKRFPKHPTLLALGFTLAQTVVVLLPAAFLGAALVSQASDAIARVGNEVSSRKVTSFSDLIALPGVDKALGWAREHTGVTPEELQAKSVEAAGRVSSFIAEKSGGVILAFIEVVMTFLMTILLFFFFLRDGDDMVEALVEMVPLAEKERRRAVKSLGAMLESIFRGSVLCAIAQGLLGATGWAIAGLPSVALAGAAMAVFSLLPIGGTAIVWAPGAIALWFSGRHGTAIFLVVWGIVVASFLADNVLKPLLIRGEGEMDTLVVFLGVFGGIPAFGLLGVFIGPVALAMGVTLVKVLGRAARASREEDDAASAGV
jgi:predicted PurR-regulated permease PerM